MSPGVPPLPKAAGVHRIAVVILALGIGASTAIFTVVDAVLLRPLPFPTPAGSSRLDETSNRQPSAVSPVNYLDWRARAKSFQASPSTPSRA